MYICSRFIMEIFDTIEGLQRHLAALRKTGSVGFVPTMGALHEGHLSLVRASASENTTTVVSIYVNPTQFNDKSDLERYPRDLTLDTKLLSGTGCSIIFAPTDIEMYPEPDTRKFDFGDLEKVMEGKHRPGHFNGVGQIVSKLFDAVLPDKAYFGLKDFQQLAVIKKLTLDQNYPIDIVPCPIAREEDGLAMSSRNTLLEESKRKAAPIIYKTLQKAIELASKSGIEDIKRYVFEVFKNNRELELEYFDIVDDNTLQPIQAFSLNSPATACIAVHAGKVRLIDNIQFNL